MKFKKTNRVNSKLTENLSENKSKAIKKYRELTHLNESDIITESSIDDWALTHVCNKFAIPKYDLKEILIENKSLLEDVEPTPQEEKIARDLNADISEADDRTELEKELDDCLKRARRKKLKAGGAGGYTDANLLIVGSAGFGKAQPLTSKVYTPYGYKLMGDIKVGDIILDGKGNPTKVLAVFPQGKRPIYKINLNDGTYIEVADNHLNSVYRVWSKSGAKSRSQQEGREDFVIETTKLKEMIENIPFPSTCYGRYDHPRFYIDCVAIQDWGNDEELPIDPYLLGCLIGDGTLGRNCLRFTTADEEVKLKLSDILLEDWESQFKLDSKKSAAEDLIIANCERYNHFRSKTAGVSGLRYQLKELGLNVKSEFKFIPNKYIFTTFENRLKLLQGLMDTDGTVDNIYGKSGTTCSNIYFTTVSKQLADDVAFLVRSLGCKAKIYKQENKTYHYVYKDIDEIRPCKDAYTVYIGAPEDLKVFTLERKANRIINKTPRNRRGIVSIDFDREDECQCIYVESSEHTYITDNLTITHNSDIVKQGAQKRGLNLYKVTLSGLQTEFMVGMPGYDPNNPGQTINLPNTAFLNQLNKPNTVLFLDELNRAHARLRAPLLQLVAHHEIQAGSETVEVPNLLFTVAAINPVSSAYGGVNSMDAAEYRRFKLFKVTPNPIEHLRYLDKFYAEDYEDAKRANDEEWMKEAQGKRALANLILKDPRFEYTSLAEEEENIDRQEAGEWRATNYASFKDALDDSDGTKDSFIKAFKNKCNPDQVKVIEDILKNYKDIDDKANQALKAGTKSKVLQKQSSLFDRINDYLSSIGEDGIDFN